MATHVIGRQDLSCFPAWAVGDCKTQADGAETLQMVAFWMFRWRFEGWMGGMPFA